MAITNYSPRELTLSVSEKRGTQYVYAKQGDALSRNLSITLVDDDSALTFGSGERAAIRVLKPDGTSLAENATIGNNGVISVELSDQILAVSGLISADIVIYSGTTIILSSEVFTIEAEAAPIGVNAVSENDVTFINSLVAEGLDVIDEFSTKIAQLDNLVANAGDASQNTEIVDARVDNDGTAHTTVGANLRYTQDNWLKIVVAYDKPVSDITTGQLHIDEAINHKTIYRICNSNGANIGWLICAAVAANTYLKMQIRALYFGELSYRTKDFSTEGSTWSEWIKFETGANKVTSMSSSSTNTQYPTAKAVYDALLTKVDKVEGKVLSTNDYTTAEKNKLAGIEAQANKTVVDSALSSTSENPVQNKAVYAALNTKANTSDVYTKSQTDSAILASSSTITQVVNSALSRLSSLENHQYIDDFTYNSETGALKFYCGAQQVGNTITIVSGSGADAAPAFNGGRVEVVDNRNQLIFTKNGVAVEGIDPIVLPATGGSSSSTSNSTLQFSITSSRVFAVADTAMEANVEMSFVSKNANNVPTGPGTLEILIGGVVKRVLTIQQGTATVNVMSLLMLGENRVTFRVTDADDNVASRACTISRESLSLSWNLDTTMENTGTLSIQLTPVGSERKTIVIKVDGVQYSSDIVSYSNRIFTKNISGLSHGAHTIEAYATMSINGAEITSATLKSAVAQISGNTPIVAAIFPDSAEQYTTFTSKYRVVAPEGYEVRLYVNNVLVDTRSSDHTEHDWTYRPVSAGQLKLGIGCGVTGQQDSQLLEKTITVSSLTSAAEVDDGSLAMKVDPSTITDIANFTNNGYGITLSNNFDHINGGLQTDADGVRCIRITAGDRLTINYPLFAGDATQNGKEFKIIYKVENSSNKNADVISCMYSDIGFSAKANNIYLHGSLNTLDMSVCEGEKTELDVNIQNRSGQRLMSMWESCSTFAYEQYSENEEFTHGSVRGIVFGSDDADVILYLFRAYNRGLTEDEIKANFIFDGKNGAEILARQSRNAIYNSNGINLSEAIRLNPDVHFIVIHTRDLPVKTEETNIKRDATFEHFYGAGGAYHQWTATGNWGWQGTSTVENIPFAGGNINFSLSNIRLQNDATVNINGTDTNVLADGYAMNGIENSIPAKKLTFKKNITEQSNIINKMCGEMYHRFQTSLRAARQTDPRTRDCMESVMCCVFITNDNDTESNSPISLNIGPDSTIIENGVAVVDEAVRPGETIFYGLGNLCSNKDSVEVFHYDPIVIEVGNNDDPRVLFKSNDYSGTNFYDNFEFRYLDEEQFTEAQAIALFKSEVADFVFETDWTRATGDALSEVKTYGGLAYTEDTAAYRKARWKAEASNHFDMDSLYWHHNFTLFMLLRDNRAKNMFWSRNANGKWGLWFNWDNDTGLCKNNKGKRDIEPGYLDTDIKGTSYVFNGATNALFSNLRENNFAELKANYITSESAGAWNLDFLINYCNTAQNQICESLWIEDAKHNAIRVLTNLNNKDYLEKAHGKLQLHIHKALMFQKVMVDSYYNSGEGIDDSASFRGYTPSQWAGVQPNPLFTITPYTDMFINLHAGSKDYRVRAYGGQPVQIDLSESLNAGETVTLNDAEIYIRNAGWIQSLGDMSALYLGAFTASKLKRVQTLIIGSDVAGYTNTMFTGASFGNCKKLTELNMGGLINAQSDYNFSSNVYLKKLYTKGSGITGITFANGGKIEEVHLNAINTLFMRNLNHLSVFDIASYDNLKRLFVLDSPSVDIKTICQNAINLERIYAKGVNIHLPNSQLLMRLQSLNGYNDSGQTTDSPMVSGQAELDGMSNYCRGIIEEAFPALNLLVYSALGSFNVRFMLDENTQYGSTQIVEEGTAAVRPSVNPSDSITPENVSSFVGWDGAYDNITQDTDVMASWIVRTRYYNVKWVNSNGNILQSQRLGYGEAVAYSGNDLPNTSEYLWTGFDWKSWEYAAQSITDSTEELTVQATYEKIELPPIRNIADYDFINSNKYGDTSAYTLGELAAICRAHLAQDYGFEIHQKVNIVLEPTRNISVIPDENIICNVEGFNRRRLANGGNKDDPHEGGDFSQFANILWGFEGALANGRAINGSPTNVGGYAAMSQLAYFNTYVLPAFPPGWRSIIKLTQRYTTAGNSSTTMVKFESKIAPFNAAELGWSTAEPYASELDSARYNDGSVVLPYYRSNTKVKKKLNGTGAATDYWTCSPNYGSSSAWCSFNSYGTANLPNGATISYAVVGSFCT